MRSTTCRRSRALSRKQLRTAYHETGHAIADVRFGFICDHVTIIPDEENGTLDHEESLDNDYCDLNSYGV